MMAACEADTVRAVDSQIPVIVPTWCRRRSSSQRRTRNSPARGGITAPQILSTALQKANECANEDLAANRSDSSNA